MNRRQRRFQLKAAGMLRVKNMYNPFTEVGKLWYNKTRQEGAQLHAQNLERIEANRSTLYDALDQSKRTGLKEFGYSEEQVELMMEAWALTVIKDKDTYRADRKESARLLKQAHSLAK